MYAPYTIAYIDAYVEGAAACGVRSIAQVPMFSKGGKNAGNWYCVFGYVQVSLAIISQRNRLPHNSVLRFYEISVLLGLLGVLSQATVAHTAMATHRLRYGAPGTVTSAWCMQCSILIILLTPVTTLELQYPWYVAHAIWAIGGPTRCSWTT